MHWHEDNTDSLHLLVLGHFRIFCHVQPRRNISMSAHTFALILTNQTNGTARLPDLV
jgi:hypothetical protein